MRSALLVLAGILAHAHSFDYTTAATCAAAGTYLDGSSLDCLRCGANQSITADSLGCQCATGFYLNSSVLGAGLTGVSIACAACPAGTVLRSRGNACGACEGGITGSSCVCPAGSFLSETYVNGTSRTNATCIVCALGTQPSGRACVPCSGGQVGISAGVCGCPASTSLAGDGTCWPAAAIAAVPASALVMRFTGPGAFVAVTPSVLFSTALASAYAGCLAGNNRTACQVLANLCVLQLYQPTHFACSSYSAIAGARGANTNDWPSWPDGLPWLYYSSTPDPTSPVLAVSASLSRGAGLTTQLTLRLAAYSVHGIFAGWLDLGSVAQLCPNTAAVTAAYSTVGLEYSNRCTLNLTNTAFQAAYAALQFFDPYLMDTASTLYPIPVRIANYQPQLGASPYVRRFFMYDQLSGQSASGTAAAVRVATSIELSVRFQGQGNAGNIFVPLLTVTYGDYLPTASIAVGYSTTFSSPNDQYYNGMVVAAGVCAGLAFLSCLVGMTSWRRRNKNANIDFRTLIETVVMLASTFSTLITAVLVCASLYWLIYYRNEKAVEHLLPTKSSDPFVPLLAVAVVSKLIEVAHIIYMQTHADVFFIDWEQPPASSTSEAPAFVPLWRTVLVANEWNELQSCRKTYLPLQLIAVLLFLYVAGADDLGSAAPQSNDTYPSSDHYLLRFASLAILYFSIAIVQLVVYGLVYSRFIEDKLGQFTDLCSVCNISVFILGDSYHGYYIHGRSVHGYAEVDMWQMRENLKKEEANMTGHRGLLPNSDLQTFEIHVPAMLRDQLDAVLLNLMYDEHGPERARTGVSDKAIHGHRNVNRLLCAFLDHSFRDLDYVVQDRTALAGLLGLTPEIFSRGVFYMDAAASVSSMLLLGQETALLLLDFLVFAVIDLLATNYVAGAAVAFALYLIYGTLRDNLGRRNLGRKTLIDERFLI
eukprot:m.61020 g.61020  ORF g.61020 m.61020 type:complete len:932 (+) comp7058_c0_seq2:5448-8243(+)